MSEGAVGAEEKIKLVAGHLQSKVSWDRNYRWLQWIHYTIGISALALTILGASGLMSQFDAFWHELILYFAAFLTALVTFMRAAERADRYRSSWAMLGNQIDRFLSGEADIESVRRVCEYGEAVVRFTTPLRMPYSEPEDAGKAGNGPAAEREAE